MQVHGGAHSTRAFFFFCALSLRMRQTNLHLTTLHVSYPHRHPHHPPPLNPPSPPRHDNRTTCCLPRQVHKDSARLAPHKLHTCGTDFKEASRELNAEALYEQRTHQHTAFSTPPTCAPGRHLTTTPPHKKKHAHALELKGAYAEFFFSFSLSSRPWCLFFSLVL